MLCDDFMAQPREARPRAHPARPHKQEDLHGPHLRGRGAVHDDALLWAGAGRDAGAAAGGETVLHCTVLLYHLMCVPRWTGVLHVYRMCTACVALASSFACHMHARQFDGPLQLVGRPVYLQ